MQHHDLVILLHGILRTRKSMLKLADNLEKSGFLTLSFTYASTKKPIHELADDVRAMMVVADDFHSACRVHFVTHSMGGLVLRHLLARHRDELGDRMGRVVMLGPPNQGSELADIFHRLPPFQKIFGPAGNQLTMKDNAAHVPQEPVDYDLGIIVGTTGWPYPDGQLLLKGPHDGRVTVANTKLDGMKQHMTLPVMHGLMMNNKDVQQNVAEFLMTGAFLKP